MPLTTVHSFDFRCDTRQLWVQVAQAYGLKLEFDDSVTSTNVRGQFQNVSFATAADIAEKLTHTFFVTIGPRRILIAPDTEENRRTLQHYSLRTFYFPQITSVQDLQDRSNLLRTMFDLRYVVPDSSDFSITVRAPREILDDAARVFDDLDRGKPEIVLEVHTIQVSKTFTRQLGLRLPLQFTLFNVPTELRKILSNVDSNTIDELIKGGLNATDAAALAAALVAQSSSSGSPLLQPFAAFGGGNTLTGISLPSLGADFNETRNYFTSRQQVALRAQQGSTATLRIGDRYPIKTASYQPLALNPTLAKGLAAAGLSGLNSASNFQNVPQFSYEDLGLTLKVQPTVVRSGEVKLDLDMQVKSLSGQSVNEVPVISNREYKGVITAREGEASVLAGSITDSEQRSLSGLPLLSRMPGLGGKIFGDTGLRVDSSQMLIIVTPHILRAGHATGAGTEIYLSRDLTGN